MPQQVSIYRGSVNPGRLPRKRILATYIHSLISSVTIPRALHHSCGRDHRLINPSLFPNCILHAIKYTYTYLVSKMNNSLVLGACIMSNMKMLNKVWGHMVIINSSSYRLSSIGYKSVKQLIPRHQTSPIAFKLDAVCMEM